MKKILIITSGPLPVPASKGGAVESLLQMFIDVNEEKEDFYLEVISSSDADSEHISKKFDHTKFYFIDNQRNKHFVMRKVRLVTRQINEKIFKLNRTKLLFPEFIKKAKMLIQKNNYDTILVLNTPEVVLKIKPYFKNDLIAYLHNDHLNIHTYRAKKIVEACTKIFVVSEYIKSRVMTIDDVKEEKIEIIYNGIDTSGYTMLENNEYLSIRRSLAIKKNEIAIVLSGRLHPTKGILEVIKAVKKANHPKIKLIIVGGAFFSNNKKNKYIRTLERESLGMNDCIIFTGHIPREDIPKLLLVSDIAIVPSLFEEPSGLTVLEAQMAGLPLITTNVGGIPEIIHRESTLLLDPDVDFVKKITKSILYLTDNEEIREEMGRQGKKFVSQFSRENYYDQLEKKLKE